MVFSRHILKRCDCAARSFRNLVRSPREQTCFKVLHLPAEFELTEHARAPRQFVQEVYDIRQLGILITTYSDELRQLMQRFDLPDSIVLANFRTQ